MLIFYLVFNQPFYKIRQVRCFGHNYMYFIECSVGLNAGTIQYAARGVNPQVVVKMEPGVQSSNAPGTSNPTVVQRLSQLDGNGDFSDEEEDEDDYRYNDDDQDDNEDDLNDEENDGNCEDEVDESLFPD